MFRMNHSACLFGASLRDANSVFIQGFTERESLRDCLKPTIGMNVAKCFDGEGYKGLPETCRRHGHSEKSILKVQFRHPVGMRLTMIFDV